MKTRTQLSSTSSDASYSILPSHKFYPHFGVGCLSQKFGDVQMGISGALYMLLQHILLTTLNKCYCPASCKDGVPCKFRFNERVHTAQTQMHLDVQTCPITLMGVVVFHDHGSTLNTVFINLRFLNYGTNTV